MLLRAGLSRRLDHAQHVDAGTCIHVNHTLGLTSHHLTADLRVRYLTSRKVRGKPEASPEGRGGPSWEILPHFSADVRAFVRTTDLLTGHI